MSSPVSSAGTGGPPYPRPVDGLDFDLDLERTCRESLFLLLDLLLVGVLERRLWERDRLLLSLDLVLVLIPLDLDLVLLPLERDLVVRPRDLLFVLLLFSGVLLRLLVLFLLLD